MYAKKTQEYKTNSKKKVKDKFQTMFDITNDAKSLAHLLKKDLF